MNKKTTISIKDLIAERERLQIVVETFLFHAKISKNQVTKTGLCIKAQLSPCYLSVILTDETYTRRVSREAAEALDRATRRHEHRLLKSDLRPDIWKPKL